MPTPQRAWEAVLHRIEADLIGGALQPGDHLPPERALAVDLGVGRSSVREALRVLEVLGLIRTQTGSGPQSGAIIVARPAGGMSLLMRLQVAAHGFAIADIVHTRLVLETAVVAELAQNANGTDLSTAAALLDAMDDTSLAPEAFLALDAAFHVSLAAASGNSVIASVMTGLRSSIEAYVLEGAADLPAWSATSDRLRHEHRGIITAIEALDPDLAQHRVRDHIKGYYRETRLTDRAARSTLLPTSPPQN